MARPTTVWITRTLEGGEKTAQAIQALGFQAIVAPVLKARAISADLDHLLYDALILTSRNGLKAFSLLTQRRDVPVWCVGRATASAARAAGFTDIHCADGDVAALIHLIRKDGNLAHRMLYAAPSEPAQEDLTTILGAAGFSVREVTLYETTAIASPLSAGDMDRMTHVLIHSAKAALPIARVLQAHHNKIAFNKLIFICISEAVADALAEALALTFADEAINYALTEGNLRISSFPDDASMLMLLE